MHTIRTRETITIAANALLRDCARLNGTLHLYEQLIKLKTIGAISEAEEKGVHYEAHILAYIEALKDLQLKFTPRITRLGENVTECIRAGFDHLSPAEAALFRENALLAYAAGMEPLGGRPSKKVCTVMAAPDHRILGWDINRLCPGLEPNPHYYAKGEHGDRAIPIWCSERTSLLSRYDLYAIPPVDNSREALQAATDELTVRMIEAALNDPELKTTTFAITLLPCNRCADSLAPVRENGRVATIGDVLAIKNDRLNAALKHPERDTAGSIPKFTAAGIPVRHRELAILSQQ